MAATISSEELLEFKKNFEELMEAFYNTVLTQGQNICITNLSRISEYYINIHIYYQKANGRTVQIETMGVIDSRYKKALDREGAATAGNSAQAGSSGPNPKMTSLLVFNIFSEIQLFIPMSTMYLPSFFAT